MNILKTILDVFKKPLEDPNQAGGELLNATEMRIVFGNLPPIYDVHAAMLEEFQKVNPFFKVNSSWFFFSTLTNPICLAVNRKKHKM